MPNSLFSAATLLPSAGIVFGNLSSTAARSRPQQAATACAQQPGRNVMDQRITIRLAIRGSDWREANNENL